MTSSRFSDRRLCLKGIRWRLIIFFLVLFFFHIDIEFFQNSPFCLFGWLLDGCFCFVLFVVWGQDFTVYSRMVLNLLCSPDQPQICSSPLASRAEVIGKHHHTLLRIHLEIISDVESPSSTAQRAGHASQVCVPRGPSSSAEDSAPSVLCCILTHGPNR